MMKLNQLGKTDLYLSPIGLGSFPLGGGDWIYSWGPQDDNASIKTIQKALDLGVNWIDTAPVYGLGHAEEIVGKAIKGMSQRPIIATKCGLTWGRNRQIIPKLTRESIMQEADASLKRLDVDIIDLYQIHWPNPKNQIEEAWEAMLRLKETGKIRYPAVSNFSVQQMQKVQNLYPVASLQPPYSLIKRRIEESVLPFCLKNRIGVIPYSPIQKGLLSGKMSLERTKEFPDSDHRKQDPDFQSPWIEVHLELVDALRAVAEGFGKTVAQLAIAWVLAHPAVTAVIVGARHPGQIEETVQSGEWKLPSEARDELQVLLKKHQDKLRNA